MLKRDPPKERKVLLAPLEWRSRSLTEVNPNEVRSFKRDKFLTVTTRDLHEDWGRNLET